MNNVNVVLVILVFLCAFIGAIANALLAWAQQIPPLPFNVRSFITTLVISLVAAGGIAIAFNYADIPTVLACISAFLTGAGFNSGVSGISQLILKNSNDTTCNPPCTRFIVDAFYRHIV